MVAIRCLVVLFTCSFLPIEQGLAQQRETDEYTAQNLEQLEAEVEALTAVVGKLKGHVAYLDLKLKLIAAYDIDSEQVKKIIDVIGNDLEGVDNQKQLVLEFILELHCRTRQDHCRLKSAFAAIEARVEALENGPQPTPAPPQFDYVDGSRPAPQPYHAGRIPVEELIYWDGRVELITDRRDSFCASAQLIAKCIDYHLANGNVYHGDVYATCDGRAVLLRHTPARMQRVAYR